MLVLNPSINEHPPPNAGVLSNKHTVSKGRLHWLAGILWTFAPSTARAACSGRHMLLDL